MEKLFEQIRYSNLPQFSYLSNTSRSDPGNLEYAQGDVDTAKELYEKGDKMSHDLGPKYLLTATFDYKLVW